MHKHYSNSKIISFVSVFYILMIIEYNVAKYILITNNLDIVDSIVNDFTFTLLLSAFAIIFFIIILQTPKLLNSFQLKLYELVDKLPLSNQIKEEYYKKSPYTYLIFLSSGLAFFWYLS
jgi:hypothetical protein